MVDHSDDGFSERTGIKKMRDFSEEVSRLQQEKKDLQEQRQKASGSGTVNGSEIRRSPPGMYKTLQITG